MRGERLEAPSNTRHCVNHFFGAPLRTPPQSGTGRLRWRSSIHIDSDSLQNPWTVPMTTELPYAADAEISLGYDDLEVRLQELTFS